MDDDINMTELVQLAQALNESANRGMSREELLAIIDEEWPGPATPRAVDARRHQLFTYIDTNWRQLETLLSCPMRARNPRSCFRCLDIQVAECVITNPKATNRDEEDE